MPRHLLVTIVSSCLLLLATGAALATTLYLRPPPVGLILFVPFGVLLHVREFNLVAVALFQFPALAFVFGVASVVFSCPPRKVLMVMVILYAAASLAAFFVLWVEPVRSNHALQRTEAGGTSFLLSLSFFASLCR